MVFKWYDYLDNKYGILKERLLSNVKIIVNHDMALEVRWSSCDW